MAVSDHDEVERAEIDRMVDDMVSCRATFLRLGVRWMIAWIIFMGWQVAKGVLTLTMHVSWYTRVFWTVLVTTAVMVPFVGVWLKLREYAGLIAQEDEAAAEKRANDRWKARLDALLAREELDRRESALRDDLTKMRDELS